VAAAGTTLSRTRFGGHFQMRILGSPCSIYNSVVITHYLRKNGGATAQPIRGDFAIPLDSVQSQRSPSLAPLYLCRALAPLYLALPASLNSPPPLSQKHNHRSSLPLSRERSPPPHIPLYFPTVLPRQHPLQWTCAAARFASE